MTYEVKLENFEGPLDLLLQLITRQRVDIYEISIATITEEYLAAVGNLENMDLEAATGFLVIAATLLELKSARLLPVGDEEAAGRLLEERDLLLARLVECATFREAGTWISAGLSAGAARHGRSVSLEERFSEIAPDLLANTKLSDIVARALLVFAPKPVIELDTSHVAPITASVREAISEVADVLSARGSISFEALCAGRSDRIEIVVRFLALLELFKAGAIDLTQGGSFGTIEAVWTGEAEAAEALELAEEYTVVEPGATSP